MEAMQKAHKHGGMLYPVSLADIGRITSRLMCSLLNHDS